MSSFIRPKINLGYGKDHPKGVNSLPELIRFNATHNPDQLFGLQAISKEDAEPRAITFSQLHQAVEISSAWLVHEGATTGRVKREQCVRPVALLLGSDIGIYIYMAALMRIGTPVLCLSARLTPLAVAHLLSSVNPSSVLISSQLCQTAEKAVAILNTQYSVVNTPKVLTALSYEGFLHCDTNSGLNELEIPPTYTAFEPNDVDACIFHSSGTTGLPKPIYHSHVYPLIYAACHRLPERDSAFSINVSTLPLYHGFGLLAPSLSLSIGMPFYLFPATVIPTARSVLSALKATNARYMFSVPSILEDILNISPSDGLNELRKLEILAIGGAPIKESVGDELVSNGVKLLNHWGATEIGAIAPIEPVPSGYDRHYLMPRTDIGLEFIEIEGGGSLTRQLIGHPPGWDRPFIVQDLLEANPANTTQVRILGRTDDLIVLATGEKIRPTSLERTVAEHPRVKAALAFGDRQFSMGLIVEIWDTEDLHLNDQATSTFVDSIAPYVERGNTFVDNHGKVAMEMLVLTTESKKPLMRTDKGSLARKANYEAFSKEIEECYAQADSLRANPLPPTDADALLRRVRDIVADVTDQEVFRSPTGNFDDADLFEMGVDSLQAKRLHAVLSGSLRVTANLPRPIEKLDLDFVFQHPSVSKLCLAIKAVMTTTEGTGQMILGTETRIKAMHMMVEEFRVRLASFAEAAAKASDSRKRRAHAAGPASGSVVLLTGSTGSLGCMLLARLAGDPNVSKIICLNRKQKQQQVGAPERQRRALEKRGATIAKENWDKIVLFETNVHAPKFGLNSDAFEELLQVTHIIHNAWPVDFNMKLQSFKSHLELVSNLALLCIESSGRRHLNTAPTRLLFLSSIAVVGRYPLLHPEGPFEVPEQALGPENTAEMGYAEAKWVAEKVVTMAGEMFGQAEDPLIQTSSIRIGQLTGAEGRGAWNESEHFPLIVRTSRYLRLLPYLQGSLSWLPVNRAADIVTELLFSKGFQAFYHVENPSRQSWSGLLRNLSFILGGNTSPVRMVPFQEWLDQVRNLGDDPRNKAMKIFDFLDHHFVRMASGPVILRTTNARADSPSMVRSTSLDMGHLEEYVEYWKTTDQS